MVRCAVLHLWALKSCHRHLHMPLRCQLTQRRMLPRATRRTHMLRPPHHKRLSHHSASPRPLLKKTPVICRQCTSSRKTWQYLNLPHQSMLDDLPYKVTTWNPLRLSVRSSARTVPDTSLHFENPQSLCRPPKMFTPILPSQGSAPFLRRRVQLQR